MGKGSSSYPQPPNPQTVASAQTASNIDTAQAQAYLNQVNQSTPFGSLTYTPTGQTNPQGIPQMQANVTLSPQQQAIANLEQGNTQALLGAAGPEINRINNLISTPFDLSSVGQAPTADANARQQATNAYYGLETANLDPMYAEKQRALNTQLANQGFVQGDQGYTTAQGDLHRQQALDYQNAMNNAITNGGNYEQQQFGMGQAAYQQALQNYMQSRAQPINELATLMGTSGGVTLPQFGQTPQTSISPTDITGPTYNSYNAQLGQFQNQQANNQSLLGSVFGLAGSALGGWLSDKNAKEDIAPVSHADVLQKVRTMPVTEWSYRGQSDRHVGPMAQDFAARFGGDGHSIDAATAFGVSMSAVKALADKMDQLKRKAA